MIIIMIIQAMVHEYFGIDNDTVDLKEYRKQKAEEKKRRQQTEGSSSEGLFSFSSSP